MTDEEQRAVDYRADQAVRMNAQIARRAGLRPPAWAAVALAANWAPLTMPSIDFDLPCVDDLKIGPVTN